MCVWQGEVHLYVGCMCMWYVCGVCVMCVCDMCGVCVCVRVVCGGVRGVMCMGVCVGVWVYVWVYMRWG